MRHFAAPVVLVGLFLSGLIWLRFSPLWPAPQRLHDRPPFATPAGAVLMETYNVGHGPGAPAWPVILSPAVISIAAAMWLVTRRP